jgi:hypothetical protein
VQAHLSTCDSCRKLLAEIHENNSFMRRFADCTSAGSASRFAPPREETARRARGSGSSTTGGALGETTIRQAAEPGETDAVEHGRTRHEGIEPIDGYELHEVIASGGQGMIVRATQQGTHREVAIKLLLRGIFASSKQQRRFEREVELAAALNHPNIVRVYESGVTPGGRPYLVMEYVRGTTLMDFLKQHTLDLDTRLELMARVCEAVEHAHRNGILHRDLKPGNVMVDGEGQPRVLDFGLAKSFKEGTAHAQVFATAAGEFLGTIAYAAPEQLNADPGGTDTRADVYALGVILYEACTGAMPYAIEGALGEVIDRIQHADAVPPRTHSREISAEVETIILRAIAKDPERRYATAGELGGDIRRYLGGQPIHAKADDTWYMARKLARRHRKGIAAVVAGILIVALFSLAWVRNERRLANLRLLQTAALLRSQWEGTDQEDEVRNLYADFLHRLKSGDTTPNERDTYLPNAFELKMLTWPRHGREDRWTAVAVLTSRISFHDAGFWGFAELNPLVNGSALGEPVFAPIGTRAGERRVLRIKPPIQEYLAGLHSGTLVSAAVETEVVLCPPEEMAESWFMPNSDDDPSPDTVYWKGRLPVAKTQFMLLSETPGDEPPTVVDTLSREIVEAAFQVRGLRVGPWGYQVEEVVYEADIPIAGVFALVHPLSHQVLVEVPYLRTRERPPRTEPIIKRLPDDVVREIKEGRLGELIVRVQPEQDVARLFPELHFYYGLPLERSVPVVYLADRPPGKRSVHAHREKTED